VIRLLTLCGIKRIKARDADIAGLQAGTDIITLLDKKMWITQSRNLNPLFKSVKR